MPPCRRIFRFSSCGSLPMIAIPDSPASDAYLQPAEPPGESVLLWEEVQAAAGKRSMNCWRKSYSGSNEVYRQIALNVAASNGWAQAGHVERVRNCRSQSSSDLGWFSVGMFRKTRPREIQYKDHSLETALRYRRGIACSHSRI